jgi:hypothetical protein
VRKRFSRAQSAAVYREPEGACDWHGILSLHRVRERWVTRRTAVINQIRGLLIALLEKSKGATLAELMKASGWQAHSVCGFLSGTLKNFRVETGPITCYSWTSLKTIK